MLLDDLHILMESPAVKLLISGGNPENELLRFAIQIGNQDAVALLLTLPEVQRLAQANDYYINESQGRFDLRAMAQDNESSMNALSTGEMQCMQRVWEHYQIF